MKQEQNYSSTISNIKKSLGELFTKYPGTQIQLLLYIVVRVVNPFLLTAIPSIAIACIVEKNVAKYLIIIAVTLLLVLMCTMTTQVMSTILMTKRNYTVLHAFFGRYLNKSITMDYSHVEPQMYQKMIGKGARAIRSNYAGAARLMMNSADLVVYAFGLLTYGGAIFMLDIRILLIMAVMFLLDILLRNHAIHYGDTKREVQSEIYRTRNYLDQHSLTVRSGKDVRLYQMENWFHVKYEVGIKRLSKIVLNIELRWYLPTIVDQFCIILRDLLAYSILLKLVLKGSISVATFTLYIGIISGFSQWMYDVSEAIGGTKNSSHELDDYNKVIEIQDEFHHKEGEKPKFGKLPLRIEFQDVSFRYEGAKEDTLSHLNLTIEAGEKLALVGNNGAGKTTIVKLLCGLYQPTEGKILIHGQNLVDMDIDEYQKYISVLFQDVNPLSFSIEMNVAGETREKIDSERVKDSLKRAGLWEKIESLPNQEKSFITQDLDKKGIQLSGGETQKLLFARTLYKDGRMLILDEPTSALDPIAESQMYDEYNRTTKGKTAVFISHRLASTQFCDRILMLENGKVAEEGTHQELLQKKGKYQEMFEIQSHYYRKEAVANEQ